jgi:hypothetical protein
VNNCLKNNQIFEGKTINYDSNNAPFTMHWKIVPIMNNENGDSFYMAI